MNCKCQCNNKHGEQTVQVKLKLHGSIWEDSLSYDPADAAQRYVESLFTRGEIDIANGSVIAVETEQNENKKIFIVSRRDVSMFDAKEV